MSRAAEMAREYDRACMLVQAISLTVLVDKFGFTQEDIQRYWACTEYLSGSIRENRVNVPDMLKTLREEYDIDLKAR